MGHGGRNADHYIEDCCDRWCWGGESRSAACADHFALPALNLHHLPEFSRRRGEGGEQVHSGRLLGCLDEGNDAVEIIDPISIDKNIDTAGWQFNAPATNTDSIDVR